MFKIARLFIWTLTFLGGLSTFALSENSDESKSLVDRTFEKTVDKINIKMQGLSSVFKHIYGDVRIIPCTDCLAGKSAKFIDPRINYSELISVLRNGKNDNGEQDFFVFDWLKVNEGICPATKEILTLWPPDYSFDSPSHKRLRQLWLQASLGSILTTNVVNRIFSEMGVTPASYNQALKEKKDSIPVRAREIIERYCDFSSRVAAKKLFERVAVQAQYDFLNNKDFTNYETGLLNELIDRSKRNLLPAEEDPLHLMRNDEEQFHPIHRSES